MNKKELMETIDISQSTFSKLLRGGMPSEDDKNVSFNLEKVISWRNSQNQSEIEQLIIGEEYNNKEIAEAFKCSTQGGMRRSHTSNSLVLFSDHSGNSVYEDMWIEDILHYTGMGLKGDQTLEKTQNKILANSNKNRVKVFLFETHQATIHTYLGQVVLTDDPYTIQEKDSKGNLRLVYKFPLKKLDSNFSISKDTIEKSEREKEKKIKVLTPKELAEKAKLISDTNKDLYEKRISKDKTTRGYRYTKKKEFIRDPFIATYVKDIAKGICQLCEQVAPFEKEGKPFLHSHHIEYLSNGGLDTIENCIAVCPNCHARIHELEDIKDKKKLLKKVSERS